MAGEKLLCKRNSTPEFCSIPVDSRSFKLYQAIDMDLLQDVTQDSCMHMNHGHHDNKACIDSKGIVEINKSKTHVSTACSGFTHHFLMNCSTLLSGLFFVCQCSFCNLAREKGVA